MTLTLFLVFLGLGIACLVVALLLTRLAWRSDIRPFGRHSRMFEIALHPERFATTPRLPLIRALNIAGVAAMLCAIGVVAFEILSSAAAGNEAGPLAP